MFYASTVLSDFVQTCCRKCLFDRLNESQPSATHTACLPLVFPPVTSALQHLPSTPVTSISCCPSRPHILTPQNQSPQWCLQTTRPAARACVEVPPGSSDPCLPQAAFPNTPILCDSGPAPGFLHKHNQRSRQE